MDALLDALLQRLPRMLVSDGSMACGDVVALGLSGHSISNAFLSDPKRTVGLIRRPGPG